MKQPRRTSRGYVLLLTLMLLPIAAAAMGIAARTTLQEVSTAASRYEELQRKWSGITVRDTLARQTPAIFDAARQDGEASPRTIGHTLTLGDAVLQIRLTDEQARLNVNRVLIERDYDPRQTAAILRQLIDPQYRQMNIRIRPGPGKDALHRRSLTGSRPDVAASAGDHAVGPLNSITQIFEVRHLDPRWLVPKAATDPSLMEQWTLWSDGRLNLFTVDSDTLRVATVPRIREDKILRLFELSRQFPNHGVAALLSQMDLDRDQQRYLADTLTDRSTTFGIWVKNTIGSRTELSGLIVQVRGTTTTRRATMVW